MNLGTLAKGRYREFWKHPTSESLFPTMPNMNKEAQFLLKKVKENGSQIVSSLEELATYYRAGRIHGDLIGFLKENVEQYGYTMCTNHSSINGQTVWYFSPTV